MPFSLNVTRAVIHCRLQLPVLSEIRRQFASKPRYHKPVAQILPAKVRPTNKNRNRNEDDFWNKEEIRKLKRDHKQQIEEFGDDMEDEDPSGLHPKTVQETHLLDQARKRETIKRKKMIRKHFNDLQPKTIDLLTWAEKENIKYLMETEPGQWTPESISQAYPISPREVEKLLKSRHVLITAYDVRKHDEKIAINIAKVKSGEIPITEDIAAQLEIRHLIPLKIGDLGINANNYVTSKEPDVTGEFASLVALPPKPDAVDAKKSDAVINHVITDGELCDPSLFPAEEGKQQMSRAELRRILPTRKLMTFDDFERHMVEAERSKKLSEDMKYMLRLNEDNEPGDDDASTVTLKVGEVAEGVSFSNASFPSKKINHKIPVETGDITLNVEGSSAYIYDKEIGIQKPFSSKRIQPTIDIPEDQYKPGATYKVNDCYYDENGEFMYRVV